MELKVAKREIREFCLVDFDRKKSTLGTATFEKITFLNRGLRSLIYFFGFLGLAVLFVFVPVLHFIFVPLFSILAVLSAFLMFMDRIKVVSFQGECPYCHMVTNLNGDLDALEFRISCDHCRQLIFVSPSDKDKINTGS